MYDIYTTLYITLMLKWRHRLAYENNSIWRCPCIIQNAIETLAEVNPRRSCARARARACVYGRENIMHIHPREWSVMRPKKVGTGLARQRTLGSARVWRGFSPAREGAGGAGRGWGSTVPREFPGWCRGGKGVEWNGMELSVVPVGRGGTEGPRGRGDRRLIMQFQDCHYPRPPNSLRRFYLFCFCVSLARFFSFSFFFFFFFFFFVFSALPPHRRGRGPASFRNVNSINVTLFPFSLKTGDGR